MTDEFAFDIKIRIKDDRHGRRLLRDDPELAEALLSLRTIAVEATDRAQAEVRVRTIAQRIEGER